MSPRVYILDTETTGFKAPVECIEVAVLELDGQGDPRNPGTRHGTHQNLRDVERFKPTLPIEDGAAAAHHILPCDLADCPQFDPAKYAFLGEDDVYLIGHNVDYDWEVIGKPGNPRRICTLALAKRTWEQSTSHKLAALYYQVMGQTEETREFLQGAHSAECDIWLTRRVMMEIAKVQEIGSWDGLWAVSEIARIPVRMPFGKHGPDQKSGAPGVPIAQLDAHDRGYRQWCLRQGDTFGDEYLRRALRETRQIQVDDNDPAYRR